MWITRREIIVAFALIALQLHVQRNFASEDVILSEAISTVVQEAFIKQTKRQYVLFFSIFDENSTDSRAYINDLTNRVLQNVPSATYKILYHKQKLYVNFKQNEVVLLDNLKTFKYFYSKLQYNGNKDMSRTLLYISSLTTLDYYAIYLIFRDLYMMEMIRVALLIKLANNDIMLLTYFPFTRTSCRDFNPVLLNHFIAEEHRWASNEYFPNKLTNFYGCPIYCCTWKEMPYFDAIPFKRNPAAINYIGFEAELLKLAAASLNFTINIHWIKPLKEGVANREKIFSEIFAQRCDLALGAFNYRSDLHTATFSQTNFHSFSHIYIVTNVVNWYTLYEQLAFPFSCRVWFALGLTYALSSALICCCGMQRKWENYRKFSIGSANKTPHFNFYGLAVGSSMAATHMPKRNFSRFLLICWILLMFILRVAYQSGMYQMMRSSKQWNAPATIESVFERNYLISMTPENYKYLDILPATQRVKIFNTTILNALTEVVNAKEPIAFITPYEYIDYFGKKNGSQWDKLHLVKERLLTQQITIYVRHNSYLLRILNKKISDAQYYGFTEMWTRKNSLLPVDSWQHGAEFPLTMEEMGAVFMLLVWLHALAFGVFLVELMRHFYGNVTKKA